MENKIIKYLKDKWYDLDKWFYYKKEVRYKKQEEKAVMYCYEKLFKHSEPSGDFKELMKTAEIGKDGRKIIPYMDYYLPSEKLEEIIAETIKKYKIKEWYQGSFRLSILFGCSPTSYKKENSNGITID